MKEQLDLINQIITYIDNNRSKHHDGDFDGSLMHYLMKLKEDRMKLVEHHNNGFKKFMNY